jgi:hypothetical protein
MPGFDPQARELFEHIAVDLYDEIVQAGGMAADDPRICKDEERKQGFELLVELGLVQREPNGANWLPVEPSTSQGRVVTPLGTEGARLLDESARWARAFQSLSHSWKRSPQAETSGPVTYLHGEAISPYLTTIVSEAETELLTAQPQAGREGPALAAAALRDIQALDRGIAMRTLYQHSARRHAATHKYVAQVTSRGAEVRTLDEFFNRMIVVDRRVAVIPAGEDMTTAVAVREPSVVAYLVDVFDRAFARGRPFTSSETPVMKEIATEQRMMTIRMLIEGHADSVSAKRLGVSPRTYAGYVAELKEEYDAETRFQLGYTMGRLGISGRELPEGEED